MKKSGIPLQALCFAFLVPLILPAGCASLRMNSKSGKALSKLEELIVPLEAMGGTTARQNETQMRQARDAVTQDEKNVNASAEYRAKIAAWSGRLSILEGKYSQARDLYRQSLTLGDTVPATILGIRLEGDPERRLELAGRELLLAGSNISAPGYGEMYIEKARALLDLKRYAEAADAFDTAFASRLPPVYRSSYQNDRDRAGELRGAAVFR
ncbi:MAG: tetratricopeptide repeat protein [Treponema sp.]|nr:tetratricopeptide repeat protein [Treponema sp.]